MKKNLAKHLFLFLLAACFAVFCAFKPEVKPVIKVTIPGFPVFQCTDVSNMPLGANGGLATLVKTADNIDQQFNKAAKNATAIKTMDVVYFKKGANGQLTKTQGFHFTKLVVKSVAANINKVTAIGLSYENMTKD